MDPMVVYVPRCIQNGMECVGLEALKEFEAVPQLNGVSVLLCIGGVCFLLVVLITRVLSYL
jgi:hypothetical protein